MKVGYAFVSFWPTGEQRNYDATKGEFGRPKILNPITGGGFGGVELAGPLRLRRPDRRLFHGDDGGRPHALQDAGKYKG